MALLLRRTTSSWETSESATRKEYARLRDVAATVAGCSTAARAIRRAAQRQEE
jgi:hypothetical protein